MNKQYYGIPIKVGYYKRDGKYLPNIMDSEELITDLLKEYPNGFTSLQALEYIKSMYFVYPFGKINSMSTVLRPLIKKGLLDVLLRTKHGKYGYIIYGRSKNHT